MSARPFAGEGHALVCAWCGVPAGDGRTLGQLYLCSECDPGGTELRRIRDRIAPYHDPTHSLTPDAICYRCGDLASFTNIRLCKPCWRDNPLWTCGLACYQDHVRLALG